MAYERVILIVNITAKLLSLGMGHSWSRLALNLRTQPFYCIMAIMAMSV